MPCSRPRHLRDAVLRALPPSDAAGVSWTGARFPTIFDVSVLRHLVFSLGLSRTRLLSDDSPPTRLEGSSGNWEAVMSVLGDGPGGSVADLAAAFRTHVAPSAAAASTRAKDWAGWRAVLTWATARGVLGLILPMYRQTLDRGPDLGHAVLPMHSTYHQGCHRRRSSPSPALRPAFPASRAPGLLATHAEPDSVPGHPGRLQVPDHTGPRPGDAAPEDIVTC